MKKYTLSVQTTIFVEGTDDEVKDFAEKKASEFGENTRILYLGEVQGNFVQPKDLINNL